MVYTGKVVNGVIVLQEGQSLPEGTCVVVEPSSPEGDTLGQRLLRFAGTAQDLPPDMARNHDRYLHGAIEQ